MGRVFSQQQSSLPQKMPQHWGPGLGSIRPEKSWFPVAVRMWEPPGPNDDGNSLLAVTGNFKTSATGWTGVWGSQSLFPVLMKEQVWSTKCISGYVHRYMHVHLEPPIALTILPLSNPMSLLWHQDSPFFFNLREILICCFTNMHSLVAACMCTDRKPTTLACRDNALTNWATQPGPGPTSLTGLKTALHQEPLLSSKTLKQKALPSVEGIRGNWVLSCHVSHWSLLWAGRRREFNSSGLFKNSHLRIQLLILER